jgi:DNA polymerase III subunit alpha
MTNTYVPLRIHTPYSIAEGAAFLPDLSDRLAQWSIPAAGVADTNSIAGAFSIKAALTKSGIQPLQGIQLSVQHAGLTPGTIETSDLILFAMNEAGYNQICVLASWESEDRSALPLTELIKEAACSDVIVLTGGPRGPIDKALAADAPDRARQRMASLKKFLGDRLYCEVQRQAGPSSYDAELREIAREIDVPCVATSEAWFLDADFADAHDALLCIAAGMTLDHDDRQRADPAGYLKEPDEFHALFEDAPDAVANTIEIAKRCCFMIEETDPELPAFPTSAGRTEAEELRAQAKNGLLERLQEIGLVGQAEKYRGFTRHDYFDRLDYELGVIENMGFPGYFLIVADFIAWAKTNDIPVGPGRGSGAGSIVAWALTITDLDPLRYGLYFERFLNPERVSMPDFDIDFCQERRDEVIDYVREKYGHDRVAQIGTLGKLQARAVVRDVGRVLQVPFPVVNRFCNMIPNNPSHPVTLSEAVEMEPLSSELKSAGEDVRRAFEIGQKLEGLYRHQSTHAAGVVIGNKPIHQIVPTYRDAKGTLVTSFDMKSVEKAGLVKFDFLGLKTLDVIKGAIDISDRAGEPVELSADLTEDPETYKMLCAGNAFGVFQLESAGMKKAMVQIQPTEIEDIIALVALYRPGPMENIPVYAAVKNGEEDPHYLHPEMEATLAETRGIIVYQEQVMKLAQDLAGYTLGGADMLRRAMGKKIQAEMDAQRAVFLEGAAKRDIEPGTAEDIFELINKFANYGFNKSHAAAYAVIAFQTAYLRAHHPEAFLAASMNLDIHDVDKISEALENARRSDILHLSPDINASKAFFDIERSGERKAIRHGLSALRGVGVSMAREIIAEREANGPFTTFQDFITRTKTSINKKLAESLISAGALDGLSANRNAMWQALPGLLADAGARAEEAKRGQFSMFDLLPEGDAEEALPDVVDWSEAERLQRQYKVVGFFLDGHPIEAVRESLNRMANSRQIAEILDTPYDMPREVSIGGIITESIFKRTAKKDAMLILKLSDETGITEIIAFREGADAVRDRLERVEGSAVRIEASVSVKNDEVSLFLRDIEPLNLDLF